ncbi:MAG: sigma-70 family RNA polymerase sigma factor [Planctomycetes bacterium]|nr:sigma-70 family RNA polymerase sigma factor [Planctomycetota bacterium]
MNSRADSGGGINITRTIRGEVLDRFKAQSLSAKQPVPIIHRVAPSGSKLAVQGSNFTPSTAIIVDGLYAESEYIDDTEIWVTVPKSVRLGAAIVACTGAVGTVLEEIDEPVAPDRADEGESVRQAISRLPEMDREIVVLRYFDEMSYEQLQQSLGISIHAVKGRLFRAKQRLKEHMNDKDSRKR